MEAWAEVTERELIFERKYDDGDVLVHFTIDDQYRSSTIFRGKGNMPSARAFVRYLDEAMAELGTENKVTSINDLRGLRNSPLRAQFLLGKWLFGNKKHINKIGIFGGRPWEMKLAKAIMKIARMGRVSFFKTEREALDYLGW